ncbi:hypothetical protein J0H58_18300 [bacterium]|nr:hypothetical protein [bacterium]
MTPAERTELDGLLSSLCDDQLTEAEQTRLEQLLADPDARRRYLRYVDLHSYLQTKQPAPARAPEAARTGRQSRGWLRYGAAAVAAAVAAACATILVQSLVFRPDAVVRDGSPADPGASPEVYVATLIRADGCEWDGPVPLVAGRRVGPGELRLKKGLARLVFDSNATLILEGGTVLRVESASAATLLAGRVVFRGDDNPEAFDLRTPRALLQDLGTEYAVAVGLEGEEVHVFSGEVRRLTTGAGGGVRLNAGQARRFASDPADAGSPTALAPASFVRELPPLPVGAAAEGVLAYDGFDYPADVGPEAEGRANGGVGWAGAWQKTLSRLKQERTPPHPVFNPTAGLSRPGATVPAVGGSFDFPGFAKAHRRLRTPVRMDADGVYYLSFLFRREGPQAEDLNALSVAFRTTDELDVEARDQPDPRMRMNFGMYRANEAFTHLNRVGVHLPLPLSYGQTYLFAAKVVTGRAMPDQAFVRVYAPDEAVGWEEPIAWSLVGPQVHSDLVFDWLQVHVNSRTRQTVDELRLGTTWAAVVHPWIADRADED